MSKATFICEICNEERDVFFNAGTKPASPICEKCKKEMKRKFGKINVGRVIPDDIMYASRMMAYHSSKR